LYEAIRPSDQFLASLSKTEREWFEKGGNVDELTPRPFVTKDSGQRQEMAGGMVRDVAGDKPDWTLLLKGPMLQRWMELLNRGAKKYGKHNWLQGVHSEPGPGREEVRARFMESAFRHFMQWAMGDRTEDHAAAVIFNINGFENMLDVDKERNAANR
jgi:hypothetical protein